MQIHNLNAQSNYEGENTQSNYEGENVQSNCEREFVESILKNWVVLSIGTKGSGKTYLLLKYLKFAILHNIYDQYVLVLPMFEMEENGSYKFIDAKNKDIFIFDAYNEIIIRDLIKQQTKEKKKKRKYLL